MKKLFYPITLVMSICLCIGLCACGEHKHDTGKWIDEVSPTCSQEGVKGHYHCDECGQDVDANGNVITDLKLSKVEHKLAYVSDGNGKHTQKCIYNCGTTGESGDCTYTTTAVLTQATCSSEGEEVQTCTLCGDSKTVKVPGSHIFDKEYIAAEATCTSAGNIGYKHCSVCDKNIGEDGKILENDAWKIPATGTHVYGEGVITKAPTCKDTGEKTVKCLYCDETKTETLSVVDHYPIKVPETPATCEETGLTPGEVCAYCEKVLKAQEVIPALNHTFGKWEIVVEPDDVFGGLQMRTCLICAKSENEEIEKTDHVFDEWKYDEKTKKNSRKCTDCGKTETIDCIYNTGSVIAPTCTEKGYTELTCQLCGHVEHTDETEALGHKFEKYTADETFGDEKTEHKHTHTAICSHCGITDTKECDLSIKTVVAPTCEVNGYTKNTCSVCGSEHEDQLTDATGHTWSKYTYKDENRHVRTCSVCQKEETQACYYTAETTPATCTQEGKTTHTCTTCEHSYEDGVTPMLEHAWDDWKFDEDDEDGTRSHSRTCKNCNKKETEDCTIVSVEDAPTCLSDGTVTETCSVCLTIITKDGATKLGHDWDNWTNDENDPSNHTRTCKKCGETETAPHNLTEKVENEADCLNAKKVKKTCSDCGYSFDTVEGTALGHDWEQTNKGSKDTHSAKCKKCDATEEQSHVFSESNLCSVCGYDCLTYAEEGGHSVLTNDAALPATATKIVIPETHNNQSVTKIGSAAFFKNTYIREIEIPASVTSISSNVFTGCSNLTTITFKDESALKSIGTCAFELCTSLVTIDLPASVESVGYGCFQSCTKLTDVGLDDNVKEIGSFAFNNTALIAENSDKWENGNVLIIGNHLIDTKASETEKYEIPEKTVSIGRGAFTDWTSLKELTIPESVVHFDTDAFKGCDNLTKVTYSGGIETWMKITFANDLASPLHGSATNFTIEGADSEVEIDGKTVKSIPAGTFRGTSITKVTITEGVTSIGEEAFENCTSLTSITLPDTITYIGKDAFKGCGYYNDTNKWTNGVLYINNHLIEAKENVEYDEGTEYKIKEGTLTIGILAFANTKNVTKIVVPKTVVRIGAEAFSKCTSLTGIAFEDTTVEFLANKINSISRVYSVDKNDADNLKNLKHMDGEWKFYRKVTK